MRLSPILGGLALALVATNGLAQADPAKAQALARFQEGVALHDKGQEEEAYLRFTEAYAVVQTPAILFNLARTEQLTGRLLDAAAHFRLYVGMPEQPRLTSELRAKARVYLTELDGRLGHVSVTAAAGAHVKMDGKEVGVAPLREAVDVEPGIHAVDAESGGTTLHEKVNAVAGKVTEVTFVGAVVGGDTHVVRVVPVESGVGVAPPVATNVEQPMKREPYWNGRRTVGVVIAGVGVVGLVVGGVFGGQRGSETTDAANALAGAEKASGPSVSPSHVCTNPPASGVASCSALSSALSSNGSDAHAEGVLLIGGGVLAAVGLITAFWPNGSPPPAAAGLVPMTGPHVAGLQWSGSF